jgi:hypothetical protein
VDTTLESVVMVRGHCRASTGFIIHIQQCPYQSSNFGLFFIMFMKFKILFTDVPKFKLLGFRRRSGALP